jgi:hypothetical protein
MFGCIWWACRKAGSGLGTGAEDSCREVQAWGRSPKSATPVLQSLQVHGDKGRLPKAPWVACRVRVQSRSVLAQQQALDMMSLFGSAAAWGYYATLVEAFGGTGWPVDLFLYTKDTGTAPLCIGERIRGPQIDKCPMSPAERKPAQMSGKNVDEQPRPGESLAVPMCPRRNHSWPNGGAPCSGSASGQGLLRSLPAGIYPELQSRTVAVVCQCYTRTNDFSF